MFELKKSLSEWNDLKQKARQGDSEAELELAFGYEDGVKSPEDGSLIVRKNPRFAIFWYLRAAKHGNSGAQNNLGVHFSDGWGVKKDYQQALYWLKKAVRQGASDSALNIAIIYKEMGNNRRAVYWMKRALSMGDEEAFLSLGECFYIGSGVRKNYDLAVKYFRNVINAENICEASREKGMYWLGRAYWEGKGVRKSLKYAKKWLKCANIDGDNHDAEKLLEKILKKDKKKHIKNKL